VLLRFCCFTGHGVAAGVERKRRRSQSQLPYFPVAFAAAREGDAPPLFIQVHKVSQHCYRFLGVCFVIFKMFNVIFV